MVTLGVTDLERAIRFYRDGLGWPLSSASNEHVAVFRTGGVVLGLYGWEALAEDATVDAAGEGFRGVALAHNVRHRDDVSEVLQHVESVGGRIVNRRKTCSGVATAAISKIRMATSGKSPGIRMRRSTPMVT